MFIELRKEKGKAVKLRLLLVPLFVLLLGTTAYGANLYLKAQDVFKSSFNPVDASAKREAAVNPLEDNFSMLFIGIDDSEHRNQQEHSRSDALILATFNKRSKIYQTVKYSSGFIRLYSSSRYISEN